ncbi:ribonuclease T [Sphingomonas sp. A2-49]|uniref:ribonuclease T2 family protein n=1 Tax=Sphingomonas sp. A2-49 TaxID=1391375 RepID=UPI0021D1B29F|nr:ribonuclease T [Sphingomonas sp. A2-49]MCU6455893.1 ribonuclease T [Sphingomonas sp. A2-49]
MIRHALSAAALLVAPGVAQAQALRCSAPATVDRPRPDLPDARQPQRRLPIGSYTLAITWAPQYCHEHARDAAARFQCGSGNRFGFTLHGLWPDGVGKDWPQYCRATPLLSREVIRRNICATPSAQLLQHEWAKHGTCMAGSSPADYFARSTGLYAKLRYPDMAALSRGPLTAGALSQRIAAVNPGMTADMMRITANRRGWLDEVWICLDTAFRYRRCPAHQGGLSPNARVRIWRGTR